MPDGVMQWFNVVTGDGAVLRGGRVYAAIAPDVETAARWAGAHVHFDICKDHGAARAANVTLRRGSHGSRHHHRTGSLTGAHQSDAKGGGLARRSHPLEVVDAWARCLRTRDLDGALGLYESDATLHTDGTSMSGRAQLHAHLESSGLMGVAAAPEVRGENGLAVLTWHQIGPQRRPLQVRCRIAHGHIVEQWIGPPMEPTETIEQDDAYEPPRVVVTRGRVGAGSVDYARRCLGDVIDRIGEPVWFVRMKLSVAADPGRERPAHAQVTIDVDGDLVRAHVAARQMREAIDLLQRRLRDQLEHRAQHRQTLHRSSGTGESGEWRHSDLPAQRPDHFDRAVEERELIRHKTFAIDEMTPDEAAFDMDQLDYDFYLFSDLASGEDAVLLREPEGAYRLIRLRPTSLDPSPTAIPLIVDERAPATLTVADAIETLDAGQQPIVFFANATTGRGNVVYRRYDGHYGLITPY